MKIVESATAGPPEVLTWVLSLNELNDSLFVAEILNTKQWVWGDLENLGCVSGLLNRLDGLLVSLLALQDYRGLGIVLDFSSLLLSVAKSKSLYSSMDEVLSILDVADWGTVLRALKLFKVLLSESSSKSAKAKKNLTLMHKLYILGLGSHMNSPSPISLQDLCSSTPVQPIPFQYNYQVTSVDELPEDLKYIYINRERTNQGLDSLSDRQLIVACQLLSLSVFLQLHPSPLKIQDFCKTLPEIWLLPAVSELIRTPQSTDVHASALNLLSSILEMLESSKNESFYAQLANTTREIFASWNGLILNLLRDIAMPNTNNLAHPDFVNAVLDLAGIIVDCKHRIDTTHLPSMACSLLCLLKTPTEGKTLYAPEILAKVAKILVVLLPNSMEMFKEVDGMRTSIKCAEGQIRIFSAGIEVIDGKKIPVFSRVSLINSLLKLIKIALAKWDPVPALSANEIRSIIDLGLMRALNEAFKKKKYEIYEEALMLVSHMINENTNLIGELITDGTILSLLDSLEVFIPNSPKLIDIIARFLCITAFNIEGARVLESYNIVSKLFFVLSNSDPALFTSHIAVSIGESLQELITSVPSLIEKTIEGCLLLVISLKSADLASADFFFQKISNIGKLFSHTFNLAAELIKGFINRGGLEYLLEVFKLPVLPRNFNNEFYALTACFKSLPANLTSHVLVKVMQNLNVQLEKLQEITGPLIEIQDFSKVNEGSHTALMHILTEGDCYLEVVRVILQNWNGIASNYKEFCELLEKLSVLLRVLIAEQARLLCKNKINEEVCEKFNVAGDMSIIESAELKEYEENLYFCSQLTIRRVFRLAMRIPNNRGRQASNEEAGLAISQAIGEIFTQNIQVLTLDEVSPTKVYQLAMQLSDIMKVLLYEQGSTPATVLTFSLAGGTAHFSNFLLQLKQVSLAISNSPKKSYHIVNGLQILWSLSGRFLESLVMGKYLNSTYGQLVIKVLGFESSKEVAKKMQGIVMDCLEKVGFLECGVLSTAFGKSVLEILKNVCNFARDVPVVDSKAIKAVVDMGFSGQVARQALAATGTASVEMAMEWIFSHPEVLDLPLAPEPSAPVIIENMHRKLINALSGVPFLSFNISEILVKIIETTDLYQTDITLMLLSLIGQLGEKLIGETSLLEITAGMAEVDEIKTEANFDLLAAYLSVLQSLLIKSREILEIVRDNNFSMHAVKFIQKANTEDLGKNWLSSAFSIINVLIKSGEEPTEILVKTLVEVIEINSKSEEIILKDQEMLSLLNLLGTITFSPTMAKLFIDGPGLKSLLLARKENSDILNKSVISSWEILLRQLCEDPFILQSTFEVVFAQAVSTKITLSVFLKIYKQISNRSQEIFENAFYNICVVVRREGLYVEKAKSHNEISGEKWGTIIVIAECLGEIFNLEQTGKKVSFLNSEQLVLILGNLLQAFPQLISKLLTLQLPIFDVLSGSIICKSFLSHLTRNIIPFRYSLHIENGKIIFRYPQSAEPVSPSTYQNWVKVSVSLLRTLMLKQAYKQADSPVSEFYNNIWLENNLSVVKSRKKITRELKEILTEQLKSNWFANEKSMTLVRCVATLITQLLREPTKTPFSSSGSVDLAKSLSSDTCQMVKLLSEACKNVDLEFKRAGSVFNLLLAPLELLTKYKLSFALKIAKPSEFIDAQVDFIEVSEEEKSAEEEESAESSGNEELVMDDIVIESWNTEAFWADDLEEEEDEEDYPRNNPGNRPYNVVLAERALLEQEAPQSYLNYRQIFRDYEERMPGALQWRDLENDDILQVLLQRSRNQLRQEQPPEPIFARIFPESSDYINRFSIYLAENALEEPLIENQSSFEESQNEDLDIEVHVEEEKSVIPEGIDPSFLEALPEDIRNELLAQYQHVRGDLIIEAFINNPIASPQLGQDMDNASFIASLAPDLRRDILTNATEEFLISLPPDIVAEARALQERVILRDNYLRGIQPPVQRKKVLVGEDKIIANIAADEKLSASLPPADDNLLEILIKGLYLSTPISLEILSAVLLNLSAQSVNREKIIDGLISLLLQLECSEDFPPKRLYGSESFIENYYNVYAIVSIRIIDVLQYLAVANPKVPLELVTSGKNRLGMIRNMRTEETLGFQDLISLMDQNLYRTSTSHLTPLISLIYAAINKISIVPALDQAAVNRICSLLSFESLNETTVKIIVEIVTKLSEIENNKEQVIKALRYELKNIGEEVVNFLAKQQTSNNGLKEIQFLRICKVLSGVTNFQDEIDFIWHPLSDLLTGITENETQLVSTTNPILNKLLPLLESFFISHYERASNETFRIFTEKNHKVINLLIRQNPNLLNDTFNSLILKFPGLLDFENKRIYFKGELKEKRADPGHDSIKIHLRRAEVFMDSFHQLKVKNPEQMLGKIRVNFVGEEGFDAGGLTREWYGLLSREMFNPNYALFIPSANGVSFQPNSMSSINSEHIQFFKFVGRVIGKALCDGCMLDVYFTRSFYKHILGQEVTYQDMEDLDVGFYKSLKALMEINLNESDLHEYYFAYEEEEFGKMQVKELIAEGKSRRVTEENKLDYIKLLCHMKMTKNIQAQIDAFKAGFHELIPSDLISIFDSKELELLISGLPTVDLEDLKANTEYHNYTESSPVIKWFWEVLNEFSREEKAEFLQFVTGSSKVPLEGFKALPGMGGFQKFQIHKSFASTDRLPSSHTCMNQLDLPEYLTRESLKLRLRFAVSEGKEGFGFV